MAHPSSELYGSDRILLESVQALVADGWRVVTVLPTSGPLMWRAQDLGSRVLLQPGPVLRKASRTPSGMLRLLLLAIRTLPELLRTIRREKPDVVYVNTITLPLWLVSARLLRIPVLCHVHEAEENLSAIVRWILATPLLLATRLVANSQTTEAFLTNSRQRLRSRIQVIYNGVRGPTRPSAPRRTLTGRVRLLVIGRISPRKGTDHALAATEQLCEEGRNVGLEIVGSTFDGYEWFEERIREQAEAPQLAGRISFSGFTEDVWGAYERSDIVLIPSLGESFGNVAVEAMLAQRPVIATAVQGLTEIIDDGTTGMLVDGDDDSALAAAVRHLCDDWPNARSIAEAGRAKAQTDFSPARYARNMVEAVEATAATRRRQQQHQRPPTEEHAEPSQPPTERRADGAVPSRRTPSVLTRHVKDLGPSMPKISETATREGPRTLRTLWTYRWMSLLIVVAAMAVAHTLTTQFAGEPTATAKMVLADPRGNAVLRQGVTSEATFIRYLEQRADLVRSQQVLGRVVDALEASDPDLDVAELRSRVRTSSEPSGDVIVVASGQDARQAAAIANAVIEAYRTEAVEGHMGQRDATISAVEEARQQIVNRGGAEADASPQGPATDEVLTRLEIRIADILVDTSTFGDGVLFSEPAVASDASPTLSPVRSALVGGLLGVVLALAIGLIRNEQVGAPWLSKDTDATVADDPPTDPSVDDAGEQIELEFLAKLKDEPTSVGPGSSRTGQGER